jgi:hypothetical protein
MSLNYRVGRLLAIVLVATVSIFIVQVFAQAPVNEESTLFFNRDPFINPKIIKDMSSWLSDGGDQVVAMSKSIL